MPSDNKMIAASQMEDAAKRLRTGELLSEKECSDLKDMIRSLPMNIEKEGLVDMRLGLDDAIGDFRTLAEETSSLLEEMLASVQDGRIPSHDRRDYFNHTVDTLNDRYERVCQIAKESLNADELPEEGSSIESYIEAITNSKTLQMRQQMMEINNILSKFVSVKALVDSLSELLQPYQQEAREIMDKLNSRTDHDVDDIKSQTVAPRLFVQAIECDDIDSEEGEQILDKLDELQVYPAKITRGLSKKQFYIPDSSVVEDVQIEPVDELKSSKQKDAQETEIEAEQEIERNGELEDEQKIEQVVEQNAEASSFASKIVDRGILEDLSDSGLLSVDRSLAEDKKISASIFTGDIRKGNSKVLRAIIGHIVTNTVVDVITLKQKYFMQTDLAEAGLSFLKNKGYIYRISLSPFGYYYGMTSRLLKALSYKEAGKLVGVGPKQLIELGTLEEDNHQTALTRLIFQRMYNYLVDRIFINDLQIKVLPPQFYSESFLSGFVDWRDEASCKVCLILGAFWSREDECDKFLNFLKIFAEDDENIVEQMLICSSTLERAKIIAEVILEEGISILEGAEVYYYSAIEDAYYQEDKTRVQAVDIWPQFADREEDNETYEDEVEDRSEDMSVDAGLKTEKSGNGKNASETVSVQGERASGIDLGEATSSSGKEESLDKTLGGFLHAGKFYCAPAYVKALAQKDANLTFLYDQMAYALNDPMRHCIYSVDSVFDLIAESGYELSDYLVACIGLRTFFSNQIRFDYNIKGLYSSIKDRRVINEYPSLGNVLYKIVDFKDQYKKGMDAYADYRAKSISQLNEDLKKIQQEAKSFYESTILGKKSETASQRRFLETKKLIFAPAGDIGQYIKVVAENNREMQPLVSDFLEKSFIKEGSAISEENIDSDKLWAYIISFWEMAGEKMVLKTRADLMSRLRNNIIATTTKAIQILAKWCHIEEMLSEQTEDSGATAYKKIRKPLLDELDETISFIEKDARDPSVSYIDRAGLKVLSYTLDEIKRCLDGTFDEYERKYFYVPFLFSDNILLDESFLPELEVRNIEIEDLQPEKRILYHAQGLEKNPEKRLDEILKEQGDDYGTARLLVEYLKDIHPEEDYSIYEQNIQEGEAYARETAELKKEQFIGDLELAQSYGQIDNSASQEDKKEKILQIIDEWHEYAMDSSNYGFFEKVMDSFLAEIRREAKNREKDLQEQLEEFSTSVIRGLSTEGKARKAEKIKEAIQHQNYTVAEDLLRRVDEQEEEVENVAEEAFLEDFLEDYNDYYTPVAQSNTSFAALVSNRTRNKGERGGKRLADNWIPVGGKLGADRLVGLLKGLGFNVDVSTITPQQDIAKQENYLVKPIPAEEGKKTSYKHPIAAFGSVSEQEGFRVVCLKGKYDAANLIDVMKQIHYAKHTIMLLDFALDKAERRTLARRTKTELEGDKLFVVIDRTVMMYIIRNYDETKVNRMLMALVTPFGYYQPYVFKSSDVMPPEIFMGRKRELESIESVNGANIVYGGRQLGKSALLKKAKSDIDQNENGDRVVLVDIKELNYREAARKIGHSFYDEGILESDIDTDDWDELARAIRRRLQNEKNPIPYLLLLLDEADVFIESCKEVNYRPFDALKDIQGVGVGRFKFVIAGLHNIVRFQRDAALGNNSVLTHLEAITVKPFQSSEARELMEIPLHYLGLAFPKENESLITLILATTNYFPGLIQMYCAKLLQAMRNKDYAGYNETDTPVYEISEAHIKKVLTDKEFVSQIREKFIITLKLDEDNYYYLIALIMAYLYYSNGYNTGYCVADIKNAATELGIKKIAQLGDTKMEAYMEELKELNVLRSTDDTHYLFARYTFLQMLGSRSEIDDHLVEYMEG